MPSYAAFLGHQPHVSLAELAAVVPGFTLRSQPEKKIAVFESPVDMDDAALRNLGGCIALARRVSDQDLSLSDVPNLLMAEIGGMKGKVTFGLRTHGIAPSTVREMYRRYKDTLKKHGKSVRYVGNERKPAPAVLLHDSGLLDGTHGCELTLIQSEQELWIGRTIAAHDVDAYSKRDMDKPVRDTRAGLLPPKLAQVLLNMGLWLVRGDAPPPVSEGTKKKKSSTQPAPLTVFDPFCGTGVIPVECLVRGWPVLASDISQKAVNGCTKNIEWIRKEMKIFKKDVPSTVWKHDATKPFDLKNLPDVVVTETMLGPPLDKRPPLREAQKIAREVEALQEAFLRNAAATLPGVPLVCTWPVWYLRTDQIRLEKIWNALENIGYRAVLPDGVPVESATRPSLVYRRPDQLVGREIVLLQPITKP